MASAIKGPGILYVNSKIGRTDLLNEESYMKWYEEDHIPEIIETSGIDSALRCKNVDSTVDKPFLVMYPMQDIAFTQGDEFKKIKVHSDLLPSGGPIYDLAEIDVRYYGLIQKYEPKGPTSEQVKFISTAGIELGDSITEQEFDSWYREEHLKTISQVAGYIRSTRFKLLYYRTNAQSRVLKGLPPRDTDVALQEPPIWLALHEFTEELDEKALRQTGGTEWSKKILAGTKRIEAPVYKLVKSFGDGKFFH